MGNRRKIDPRELIPETRPKRRFEQGPIPPAPLVGNTQIDFAAGGVAQVSSVVNFVLPTTRVKPRGIVFVYDLVIEHSDPALRLVNVQLSRQAPEDVVPLKIFGHQTAAGLTLPHILNFATPLPFPLGGDAIYNYTPSVTIAFSAAGAAFSVAVANFNWIFYEWDAALGRGAAPALGGIGAAMAGTYKRFDVSE